MKSRSIIAPAVAAALWTLPAQADAVAEFYKDKTITVISAGEAGGAHGTYAQVIAAHIKKHIPGNPNVIIQYMLGAATRRLTICTMWLQRTALRLACRCRI